MDKALSLAQFAASEPRRPSRAWVHTTLSQELRDEIMKGREAGLSAGQIARWLHHLGYTDASRTRVEELWRK